MSGKSSEDKEPLPRGRHGLPRDEVVESQRTRTLDAMLRVVSEKGYADTRIADVIAEAGVSRKTYYELFDDKEDCFLAAYERAADQFLEAATAGFELGGKGTPWMDRIRSAFSAFLEAMVADPPAARVWTVEVLAAGPKSLERRDVAIRKLTKFIDAGREETKTEIPEIASLAIIGGINELLYTDVLREGTRRLPERLPEMIFWIAQPFFGEERAAVERDATVEWQANGASPPKRGKSSR